jgi:dihydroorotase
MSSLLLRQVRLLEPAAELDRVADVLVVAGQIAQVADRITDCPPETKEISGQGQILAPGLVDLYSHSSEPGAEEQETLLSLLQSAQAGGFLQVGILPDTQPIIDNSAVVGKLQSLYQQAATQLPQLPQIHLWGALTQQAAGEQLADFHDLAGGGVVGFADGQAVPNQQLLQRLLEYLQPDPRPMMLWPLDRQLAAQGVARQGAAALRLGLVGSPASSETTAMATILELVAAVGKPVHLMRISTARSVELITAAKHQGLPVTASTTWMHLVGDTATLASYDPHWRLDPPVGNSSDRMALVQAIASGMIDAIAIDHQAHAYEDKNVAFGVAPVGAIGLQLALPILWQQLVQTGQLTALQLWSALSHKPAHCWGQPAPSALILFDPTASWVVNPENIRSRSQNTPWWGQTITGRVQLLSEIE